jgi:RNA recognition motif-containing protein
MDADDFDFSLVQPTLPTTEKKKKKKVKLGTKKRRREKDSASRAGEIATDPNESNVLPTATDAASEDENQPPANAAKKQKKMKTFGIWVGNLNFDTTRKQLLAHFSSCGSVTRVKMPLSAPNKNRG